MIPDEKLEQFLTQHGVDWKTIPSAEHAAIEHKWISIYGDVWKLGLRHMRGARVQNEYSRHVAAEILIVPFVGNKAGPHSLGKRGPRTAAYECQVTGGLPDLSAFSDLDFFISPPDLSWTMLQTHEDYSLGGPYFIEEEWLVPSIRQRRRARS